MLIVVDRVEDGGSCTVVNIKDMSGEETPKRPSNAAFHWQIVASFSPLVLLVGAAVLVGTLVSAVFVEVLALVSTVSEVFKGALILATVSAAFFFPACGFLFVQVLLSGWKQHALFMFCALITHASLIRNCLA